MEKIIVDEKLKRRVVNKALEHKLSNGCQILLESDERVQVVRNNDCLYIYLDTGSFFYKDGTKVPQQFIGNSNANLENGKKAYIVVNNFIV